MSRRLENIFLKLAFRLFFWIILVAIPIVVSFILRIENVYIRNSLLIGIPLLLLLAVISSDDKKYNERINKSTQLLNYQAASVSPVIVEYVSKNDVNLRGGPNGVVIGKIGKGVQVKSYEKNGQWTRISSENELPKWVFSEYICQGEKCYFEKIIESQYYQSNSGCSCSSSNNCFGPRGGRYCITSGGKKRYR